MSSIDGLVAILRLAYSGERAAALAYRGHSASLRGEERARVKQIEEEEWHHRRLVGEILGNLGSAPSPGRELRALVIGRALQVLCFVAGWLPPMWAAGKLESRNIREYEVAARHAARSGHPKLVDCLLTMAEVEWDHEFYFRSRVLSHRFAKSIPVWPAPPPRETIRESFDREFPGLRKSA